MLQGAIVIALQNRFKERRRIKKPRRVAVECLVPPIQKSPSIKALDVPQIPVGEDETSFDRHNRVLKAEFSKSLPNVSNVKQLMKLTYPMRRREILSKGHTKDYNPIAIYPFLQVSVHVSFFSLCMACS